MKKINLDRLVRENWDDEDINNIFEKHDSHIERQHELNKQVRREARLRKLEKRGRNDSAGN